MLTDIEIAQKNKILKINEIANKISCNEDEIEPIGFFKGKFSSNFIDKLSEKKLGNSVWRCVGICVSRSADGQNQPNQGVPPWTTNTRSGL